ncbi:hypothetical protein RRG08_015252 [Elysia crispata]|uniref:Uncharacterized protein n=1 Tax=Elysia crispata TaxID=231223 RepID=A0AAE1D8E4_9GAST|nr:hypothetical protein RRG08_015252 [Elysia crispata]
MPFRRKGFGGLTFRKQNSSGDAMGPKNTTFNFLFDNIAAKPFSKGFETLRESALARGNVEALRGFAPSNESFEGDEAPLDVEGGFAPFKVGKGFGGFARKSYQNPQRGGNH